MKKIVSMVLALMMLMSSSVYAANYFVAKDVNGNITEYYNAIENKTLWDLEIDSTYSVPKTGGQIKKGSTGLALDGSFAEFNYTNYNATLSTGTGSKNEVYISSDASVANADHDYFIELVTTSDGKNAECQMNQLPIYLNSGIVVVQNDFAIGVMPTASGDYIRVSYLYLSDNATSYSTHPAHTTIEVHPGGEVYYSGTNSGKVIGINEWHTATQVVDFANGRVDIYLDGEYIGSKNNDYIKYLWKFAVYHPGNSAGKVDWGEKVTYIDNIKVYKATTDFDLTLTATTDAATAVEGASVALAVSGSNDESIKTLKILSSTDNKAWSEYAGTTAYLTPHTVYYKAIAYGENGYVLGESNSVALNAEYLKSETHYDVDFEDGYTIQSNNLYYNNAQVYARNDSASNTKFGTSKGEKGAVALMNVTSIAGNTFGTSLALDNSANSAGTNTANNTHQAQINEGQIKSVADIMVTELDFAYNELPTSTLNVVMQHSIVANSSVTYSTTIDASTAVYLDVSGKLYVSANTTTLCETTHPNTWYNIRQVINTITNKVDYYINGCYVTTVDRPDNRKNYNNFHKFTATTNATGGTTTPRSNANILYYDNLNIYSVAAPNYELEIDSVKYYINGTEANQIAAGTLTAEVTLTNNNATNANLSCFAAVYGGSELKAIRVVPVSFAQDELSKKISLGLGTVAATDVVKIFFWNEDNSPICVNK